MNREATVRALLSAVLAASAMAIYAPPAAAQPAVVSEDGTMEAWRPAYVDHDSAASVKLHYHVPCGTADQLPGDDRYRPVMAASESYRHQDQFYISRAVKWTPPFTFPAGRCGRYIELHSIRRLRHTAVAADPSCTQTTLFPWSRNPRCVAVVFVDLNDSNNLVTAAGDTAQVFINAPPQNETRPAVSLSASPNPVEEGESVTVTASIPSAADSPVQVHFSTTRQSAEYGDFEQRSGWFISIPTNGRSGSASVPTYRDGDTDDETFNAWISSDGVPPGYVRHADRGEVQVTIRDAGRQAPAGGAGFVDCSSGSALPAWSRGSAPTLDFDVPAGRLRVGDMCYVGGSSGVTLGAWSADGESWRPHREADAALFRLGAETAHGAGFKREIRFAARPGFDGDNHYVFDARLDGAPDGFINVRASLPPNYRGLTPVPVLPAAALALLGALLAAGGYRRYRRR